MESHLLQMRGLKPFIRDAHREKAMSHLLQMRGLKLLTDLTCTSMYFVASFTDAWIETSEARADSA